MSALLDANVLIALSWPQHEHHQQVARWFARAGMRAWATCAVTQAALLRISMQPAFMGCPVSFAEADSVLAAVLSQGQHTFLPADFGYEALPRLCTGGIHGHRQITDAWLLCTAVLNQCKLVTLHRGVSHLLASAQERDAYVLQL